MPGTASERRDSARTAVVWEALGAVLQPPALDVLDIGGGTGGFAVRVAELGHRVTVVDPSPDALAALDRRAREDGVEVTGQQGDLGSLLDLVGSAGADVVLCHGVLEVVDDPAAALATIHEVLRPGGRLSLLVAQRHAAVIARAMAGHVAQALALLDGPQSPTAQPHGRTGRRFTAEEVTGLVTGAGFEVGSVHGIRVFADLVPGTLLDLEPGAAAALLDLERAASERPEYLPLATQLHVIAKR
jgi:S-adenosylmethionine-dependent methyltransferase